MRTLEVVHESFDSQFQGSYIGRYILVMGANLTIKEASDSEIIMREDNPEMFQMMMEFFYEMKLRPEFTKIRRYDANPVKPVLEPIIALYTLANKYDADLLQRTLVDTFKTATGAYGGTLSKAELEALVHAHYPFCNKTLCPMSEAIATLIVKNGTALLRDGSIDPLIIQYGNLGGDLLISARRSGRLILK